MNTHPILFSSPMVEGILSGRKTQTRRIVKPQFDNTLYLSRCGQAEYNSGTIVKCPYGKVGDILWVRETFGKWGAMYLYRASTPIGEDLCKWKPNIHMPKDACRIFLEIKSIKVERLNRITEKDAIAEGVLSESALDENFKKTRIYWNYITGGMQCVSAKISFRTLWKSITGDDSWYYNPWVWVIEFKRIEKPENFLS